MPMCQVHMLMQFHQLGIRYQRDSFLWIAELTPHLKIFLARDGKTMTGDEFRQRIIDVVGNVLS